MRWHIDITPLLTFRQNTGIQRVVRAFLRHALRQPDRLVVLYFDAQKGTFSHLPSWEVERFLSDLTDYQMPQMEPIDLRMQEPGLFLDLDATWRTKPERSVLYRQLSDCGWQIVTYIYDLIPILHPQWIRTDTATRFPEHLQAVCRHSHMVCFDSLSALEDYRHYRNQLGQSHPQKMKVITPGCDLPEPKVISDRYKKLLSKRYLLFVGTLEPRKGQGVALSAWEDILAHEPDLHLILIGGAGWSVEGLLDRIQAHQLLNQRLHWLQGVDDGVLRAFYESAFMVLYLSRYEGYGLPLAEALGCATPTIASDNSALRESGQNLAHYANQDNETKSVADLTTFYLTNPQAHRAQKVHIRANYQSITWQHFGHELEQTLVKLATEATQKVPSKCLPGA